MAAWPSGTLLPAYSVNISKKAAAMQLEIDPHFNRDHRDYACTLAKHPEVALSASRYQISGQAAAPE